MNVDQTENESGQCESAQTKGSGIGELTKQMFVRLWIKIDCGCRNNGRLVSFAVFASLTGLDVFVVCICRHYVSHSIEITSYTREVEKDRAQTYNPMDLLK